MADWWNEDREYDGRYRGRGRDRDHGADAYEGREDRSFNPRAGAERGRVFGERETGASYTGPRYGAGGYTGYGERSVNERGYGSRNYSTGRDDRDFSAAGGGYGADLYQERNASRGGRSRADRDSQGARGYDRDQDDHWTFGFGYDLEGPDYARGQQRREYRDAYSRRDGGFADRSRRFFGRDPDYQRDEETHRGRGPQGYRRSDERINDDVHDRLTEDPHIDASSISVTVKEGEVTLTGAVISRHAKHHAEHIVEDLSGVKHVQNNLRVQELSPSRGASTSQSMPLGENSKLSDQAAGKA
jgi:osmotically-inducible protein OsmY